MATDKRAGFVYLLTNPSIKDKVKIGRVESDDIQKLKARVRALSSHPGVAEPFELRYAVRVDDVHKAENLLHDAFGWVRKNKRREFFDIAPEKVQAAMRLTLIGGSDPEAVVPQKVVAPVKKNETPALLHTSSRSAQKGKKMTTMQLGLQWLRKHYPNEANERFRPSKFYEKRNRWWFTFPCDFFRKRGHLNILLQKRDNPADFYFLRVPFTFFRDHQKDLDIRSDGEKFDLELLGDDNRWLQEKRRGRISFAQFVQGE